MTDQTPPPVPPQEPSYSAPPASSTPYGAPSTSPYTGGGVPEQKPAILSIISLVLGIIGIVGFFVVFIPIVGSIMQLFIPAAAVVLGFLGKNREPWAPKGLWLTGVILGFVGLAIAVLSLIGWILIFTGNAAYNSTSF